MGKLDGIRFHEELVEVVDAMTDEIVGGNLVVGRITRCGQPAVGLRVVATRVLTVGFRTDFKPCLQSTTSRTLGAATVAADGTFSISVAPGPPDVGFCAYSARIRIDVFEDGLSVWRSPEQIEQASLRFDHELFPGCTAGESVVIVIDAARNTIAGAEVFHNGNFVGRTDAAGSLVVGSVNVGDRLVARRLLEEHATDRDGHAEGSTADWSHRSYSTSLRVLHDASGDNVELREFVVADPSLTQRLQLSALNSLITFNLLVSIEWDATALEIRRYTDRLLEMSELLYNATDGQFLVERVAVIDNRRHWDDADIRIYANLNQPSQADLGDFFSGGGRISMNPFDSHEPAVFLHELGHYAFSVYDEYKAGPGWDPSDGPHQCTFASQASGTDFSAGRTKDACMLRGQRLADLTKICSTHPANPHATTTRQGNRDCWSVILEKFGSPRWRLRTPASRGANVDVLPDSGVPLATSTMLYFGGTVGSYIPVQAWKPMRHTSSVSRPGECPDLIVRVELNGSPRSDVKVWLQSGSRTTYQGVTGDYVLPYGIISGPGELSIRGAHVGDWVSAMVWLSFPNLLYGTAQVGACGPSSLVIPLKMSGFPFMARVDPSGPDEARVLIDVTSRASRAAIARIQVGDADPFSISVPGTARAADASIRGRISGLPDRSHLDLEIAAVRDGREVVARSTSTFVSLADEDLVEVRSPDGRFELVLPGGALPTGSGLAIQPALALPPPPGRSAFVGEAYRVASSEGDRLAARARVEFNLPVAAERRARQERGMRSPAIVRLSDDGDGWEPVEGLERDDRYVGGTTDRLGTFALVASSPPTRTKKGDASGKG